MWKTNWRQLRTAAVMIVLLLAGAAFGTWQAVRARRAEAAARAAEQDAEARQVEAERQRSLAEKNAQEARQYAAKLQASESQLEVMAQKVIEAKIRETAARVDALLPDQQFSKVELGYLEELVRAAEENFSVMEARYKAGTVGGIDRLEAKAGLCMAKGRLAWAKVDLLQCQKEYDDAVAAWKKRIDIVRIQYQAGTVDYPTVLGAEEAVKEAELSASRVKGRIAARESRRPQ
jgi:outer membrane protein TolC